MELKCRNLTADGCTGDPNSSPDLRVGRVIVHRYPGYLGSDLKTAIPKDTNRCGRQADGPTELMKYEVLRSEVGYINASHLKDRLSNIACLIIG